MDSSFFSFSNAWCLATNLVSLAWKKLSSASRSNRSNDSKEGRRYQEEHLVLLRTMWNARQSSAYSKEHGRTQSGQESTVTKTFTHTPEGSGRPQGSSRPRRRDRPDLGSILVPTLLRARRSSSLVRTVSSREVKSREHRKETECQSA